MIKKLLASIFLAMAVIVPVFSTAQAQSVDVFDSICKRANNVSPTTPAACQDKNTNSNPIYGPGGLLTKVVNIMSIIVGIAAVISIIAAGMRLVTSGSNPEEVNKAREYIQYAIIGLAVAATAQLIIRVVLTRISL